MYTATVRHRCRLYCFTPAAKTTTAANTFEDIMVLQFLQHAQWWRLSDKFQAWLHLLADLSQPDHHPWGIPPSGQHQLLWQLLRLFPQQRCYPYLARLHPHFRICSVCCLYWGDRIQVCASNPVLDPIVLTDLLVLSRTLVIRPVMFLSGVMSKKLISSSVVTSVMASCYIGFI